MLDEDHFIDRYDRRLGLAYVGTYYHGGQGSTLYRLYCRATQDMRLTNSDGALLPRDEYFEARHYAARYLVAARRRGLV